MEWTDCKKRFGNTPENENRPDLSKLSPDGFHFQAMVLKHQGRLRRPCRSGDCIDVWSISRRYLVLLYAARITPCFSNDCNHIGQTTHQSLGRPASRAADCEAIRKSQKTSKRSLLRFDGSWLFRCPDGSLQLNQTGGNCLSVYPKQHRRLSLFAQLFSLKPITKQREKSAKSPYVTAEQE